MKYCAAYYSDIGIEAGGNSCRDFRRLGEDVSG